MADKKDWVYVVTGGASGLGRACVERFAGQGSHVIILDLTKIDSADLIPSGRIESIVADVSSEADIKAAADHIREKYGRVDVIVNCAGISIRSPILDLNTGEPHSLSLFNKILQVNTVGTFNVIRLLLPIMVKNTPDSNGQRGLIINTSSTLAEEGFAAFTAYAASKGAVTAMTLPLARELGHLGIRVLAVAPSMCDTPMCANGRPYLEKLMDHMAVFPRRMGLPHEFAHLVQAITENPMLNGSTIRFDGATRASELPANETANL